MTSFTPFCINTMVCLLAVSLLNALVNVCVRARVCVCVCLCVRMCICLCVRVPVCLCVCVCMCVRVYMQICICMDVPAMFGYSCAHKHTCVLVCMYLHECVGLCIQAARSVIPQKPFLLVV